MDYNLVVLWVWIIYVQGKKYDSKGNVRTIASCKPIYVDNNYLIDLSPTSNISIKVVNDRNGINGKPGTIWSHVGNLVFALNQEPMGCEFSESRLA